MSAGRRIAEGIRRQGEDESLYYGVDVTNYGDSPTNVIVVAKDITDPHRPTVVTDDVLDGTATVDGNIITLPAVGNLTAGHKYKIEIRFTDSNNNVWEPFLEIWADE